MWKLPEKLLSLRDFGRELLNRLQKAKKSALKLPLFTDAQQVKIIASAVKKFPDVTNIEKLPGFDSVMSTAVESSEVLEAIYFGIADCLLFFESVNNVFAEIDSKIKILKFEKSTSFSIALLEISTLVLKLHFFVFLLSDRKVLVTVFAKLFSKVNQQDEPNFQRMVAYFGELDQSLYKVLSTAIPERTIQLLFPLLLDFTNQAFALVNVDEARNTGVFSPTAKPNEMCIPAHKIEHYFPRLWPDISSWLSFLFFLTPEMLPQEPLNILRLILQQGYVTPSSFGTAVYLHQEFETLFTNWKTNSKNVAKQLKKEKKVFGELLQQGFAQISKHRVNKRLLLTQELSNIEHTISTYPGLLGPKFETIYAALTNAKEDIIGYFLHRANPPPKAAGKVNPLDKGFKDVRVIELIAAFRRVLALIEKHKYVVQEYFLNYLNLSDTAQLYGLIGSVADTLVYPVVESIYTTIQAASMETLRDSPATINFCALRVNCFRAETWISNQENFDSNAGRVQLNQRLFFIGQHSRFIDEIDAILQSELSLVELSAFSELLMEDFNAALAANRVNGLEQIVTLMIQWSKSAERVGLVDTCKEYNEMCRESSGLVQKAVKSLVEQLMTNAFDLIGHYYSADRQVEAFNAAHSLFREKNVKWPFPTPPIQPGFESSSKNRTKCLLENKQNQEGVVRISRLLASLTLMAAIGEQQFHPSVVLREALIEQSKKYLLSNLFSSTSEKEAARLVMRGSNLERRVIVWANVLRLIEENSAFDIEELIRKVLLELTHHPILEGNSEDPVLWASAEPIDCKEFGQLAQAYAEWMTEFISKKMETGQVLYSPLRKSFYLSNPVVGGKVVAQLFKPELYLNAVDFQALARIMGSHGIHLIDHHLLRAIDHAVADIKSLLKTNSAALQSLGEVFRSGDSATLEAIKNIKELDQFVVRATSIGIHLVVRQALYEALQTVTHDISPHFAKVVDSLQLLYPTNIFQNVNHLKPDSLLLSAGKLLRYSDPALKSILKKHATLDSKELWELLPYALGAAFVSNPFQQAVFKPNLEAYTNNVQVLTEAYSILLIQVRALVGDDDLSLIELNCNKFVELGCVVLQRLQRLQSKDMGKQFKFVSFPSVLVFMDQFIKTGDYLNRQNLESYMPYANIRTIYHDLYEQDNSTLRGSGVSVISSK